MKKGTLHLIPNILSEKKLDTLAPNIKHVIDHVTIYCVEEIKSARRLIKLINRDINIDDLTFYFLNEHDNTSLSQVIKHLEQGSDVAFVSEAGCPAVADPGQELVALAHAKHILVKPYVGPNSILLALMASGFNGQQFQFVGYLPNKQPMLSNRIKEIEKESKLKNCTQIFIETPYRNHQLLEELIKNCQENTMLCIACNLTDESEEIIAQSIKLWKQNKISFHKKPAVFVLHSY